MWFQTKQSNTLFYLSKFLRKILVNQTIDCLVKTDPKLKVEIICVDGRKLGVVYRSSINATPQLPWSNASKEVPHRRRDVLIITGN